MSDNAELLSDTSFRALIDTIKDAGTNARRYFDSEALAHDLKEDRTVVTEADRSIESALLAYIGEHFPEDAVVGEETGAHSGGSGFVWHIDPIDGTDNFLRKIPFCAVSVARLGEGDEGSCAVVHNPITGQTFTTLGGRGAYENGRRCDLKPEPLGGKYVISIGRGKKEPWMKSATYALNEALGMKYGRCASYNCTALELAYLSAGRIDAFLTYGLSSYDYAAGLFLVKAAGGALSSFEDGSWKPWTKSLKELCSADDRILFASHPDIHQDILDSIGDPAGWAKR